MMGVDSGSTNQYVQDLISKSKVVIFSKSYCPHSKKAKDVFTNLNQKFTAIELDLTDDGSKIQDTLKEITGARTVPRVFVNGKFIGGSSDVRTMYENGKLEKLFK